MQYNNYRAINKRHLAPSVMHDGAILCSSRVVSNKTFLTDEIIFIKRRQQHEKYWLWWWRVCRKNMLVYNVGTKTKYDAQDLALVFVERQWETLF